MRSCGILLPMSSIPSKYGIGSFSEEAYKFVDFLAEAGQKYWQILPLGPTGFGDSPYQPVSAFAGNPYYISFEKLTEDGILDRSVYENLNFGTNIERVDYGAQYENRLTVLKAAWKSFCAKGLDREEEYREFLDQEADWLDDYALYMALKDKYNGQSWTAWDDDIRTREKKALASAREELSEAIDFYSFVQYEFQKQWDALHEYAGKKGIEFIGDLPFYTAADSSDVWSNPENFKMDKDMKFTEVAGCPPDAFSSTGQLWGNSIYDWAGMKKNGYEWWMKRIKRNHDLYDVLRIDHFHGFSSYYAIPAEDTNALNGKSEKGPGLDFFNTMKKTLGEIPIIAEDLGTNTPEKKKLLDQSGYPGMMVLQFAFSDGARNSIYLTHRHPVNSVVYTGTHDNATARGWIESTSDYERDYARRYINSENTDYGRFVWDLIREAYRSPADMCIIPLQDYLVKGNEARINSPGTQGMNWQWRLMPNFLSMELARSICSLADLYCRKNVPEEAGER